MQFSTWKLATGNAETKDEMNEIERKKNPFCIQSVSQPKEMIRSINKYITHFTIVHIIRM